jgi:hypothetical protein
MIEPVVIRVGDEAVAATDLRPGGIVVVHGERHSARTTGAWVGANTVVVITSGDNYGFTVETADGMAARQSLPNYGLPVYSSFGASKRAAGIAAAERAKAWSAARERWIRRVGPAVGTGSAAAVAWLNWPTMTSSMPSTAAAAFTAGLLATGAILGFGLLRLVDHTLRDVEFSLHRFSLPALCLFLVGLVVGSAWAVPRYGLSGGLLAALAGGLALAAPLPLVAALVAVSGSGGTGEGGTENGPEPGVGAEDRA